MRRKLLINLLTLIHASILLATPATGSSLNFSQAMLPDNGGGDELELPKAEQPWTQIEMTPGVPWLEWLQWKVPPPPPQMPDCVTSQQIPKGVVAYLCYGRVHPKLVTLTQEWNKPVPTAVPSFRFTLSSHDIIDAASLSRGKVLWKHSESAGHGWPLRIWHSTAVIDKSQSKVFVVIVGRFLTGRQIKLYDVNLAGLNESAKAKKRPLADLQLRLKENDCGLSRVTDVMADLSDDRLMVFIAQDACNLIYGYSFVTSKWVVFQNHAQYPSKQ